MKQSEALLSIVNLINQFRVHQELDGSIEEPTSADNNMINKLITLLNYHADIIDGLSPELLNTTSDDLYRWMLNSLILPQNLITLWLHSKHHYQTLRYFPWLQCMQRMGLIRKNSG
ncbi:MULTISPECIES: hypothetical protein [Bartonella]|uniref:hypothetical protein n=1 Tax=Bartonella TaxID=773 RepID=UPI0023605DBC|nr:hypothetical protein [Bartonella grahamii]